MEEGCPWLERWADGLWTALPDFPKLGENSSRIFICLLGTFPSGLVVDLRSRQRRRCETAKVFTFQDGPGSPGRSLLVGERHELPGTSAAGKEFRIHEVPTKLNEILWGPFYGPINGLLDGTCQWWIRQKRRGQNDDGSD